MSDTRQLVWLASYPKSGNTWLRAFLDAYFLGDVDLNNLAVSAVDNVAGLYAPGDGGKAHELSLECQYLMRPAAMLRLVRMHLADDVRRDSMPMYVKTHAPHLCANGIEMLPAALTRAVIHIVRDPRDVLPSFAKHMGQDEDTATEWMLDEMRHLKGNEARVYDLLSSWAKHTLSFLNADTHGVRTWRYEDLRADPVKHFAEMLQHSGVAPDIDRVRAAVAAVDLQKLRDQEAKKGFRESSPYAKNQFFGSGQVGGWKNKISAKNRHIIEKKFGRVMKRLGYLNLAVKAVR